MFTNKIREEMDKNSVGTDIGHPFLSSFSIKSLASLILLAR